MSRINFVLFLLMLILSKIINKLIIDSDFIKEYEPNIFTIEPYYEFRYLKDIELFTKIIKQYEHVIRK